MKRSARYIVGGAVEVVGVVGGSVPPGRRPAGGVRGRTAARDEAQHSGWK